MLPCVTFNGVHIIKIILTRKSSSYAKSEDCINVRVLKALETKEANLEVNT